MGRLHFRDKQMKLFFVLIVGSIDALPYPKFEWEEVLQKLKADMSQLAGPLNDIASGVNNFFDEWPRNDLKPHSSEHTTTRKWFETTEVPAHPSATVKPPEKEVKNLVPSIQQSENHQVFIEMKNRVPLNPPRDPKQSRFFKLPRTTKPTIFAHATVTESEIGPTYLNTQFSDDSVTELMTTLEPTSSTTTKKTTTKRTTTKRTTTTTTTTTTSINWTRNGKNNWSLLCKDSHNKVHDGPHPHPFWCTSFIYCYQGKGYEIQCRPNHNFNRRTLRCDSDYVCDI